MSQWYGWIGRLIEMKQDGLFLVMSTWSAVLQWFNGNRTEAGARQVQDLVGRLEHGVLP